MAKPAQNAPNSRPLQRVLAWFHPQVTQPPLLHYLNMGALIIAAMLAGVIMFKVTARYLDRNAFENRSFHDQVTSTLHYAQKAAIAKNRFVCIAFGANSVTLTQGASASCGGNLANPNGQDSYSISSSSASFINPLPKGFSFDAVGRPMPNVTQRITVSDHAAPIIIEMETGFVHSP